LDVSDPADPLLVGDYPLPGWPMDVLTDQALAYVLTSCSLLVFDLSAPDVPREIGSLAWEGGVPVASVLDGEMLHVIWKPFNYGASLSIVAVDLSDPTDPADAGWRVTPPERTGSTTGQRMAVIDGVLLIPTGESTWYGYRLP
jgi:hypothetical protein